MANNYNYYAIITANILHNKKLTNNDKILCAHVSALQNKYGFCYATNVFLAKRMHVSKETMSRNLNKLEKMGILDIKIKRDATTKQYINRTITLLTKTSIPIDENVNTPIDENVNTPIDENVILKDNNTSINITSINNKKNNIKKDFFESAFEYYKSKKLMKHRTATESMGKALYKFIKQTKCTKDDIKKVIDRHEKIVLLTRNDKYPVRLRTFSELFGQRVSGGDELIGEQYLVGGKYYEKLTNNNTNNNMGALYGF